MYATSSGALPIVSGTGGLPTTQLLSGATYIVWKATGASTVLTLTNAIASVVTVYSSSTLYALNNNTMALSSITSAAVASGKDIYFSCWQLVFCWLRSFRYNNLILHGKHRQE